MRMLSLDMQGSQCADLHGGFCLQLGARNQTLSDAWRSWMGMGELTKKGLCCCLYAVRSNVVRSVAIPRHTEPDAPPYLLFCWFYGRYLLGMVYVTNTKDGEKMLSSQFIDPKEVKRLFTRPATWSAVGIDRRAPTCRGMRRWC